MLRLAVFVVLLLEPLLSLARPQYFCGIPCPLTKPCNPGPFNPGCKYPCNNNNNYYDDEPYCPCPINLTVNCVGGGGSEGGSSSGGGSPPKKEETTTTSTTTTTTTTTTPAPAPQSRSGEEISYRRSGSGGRSNMLTSLFSIPGAVADTFLSGEVTL